MPSSVWTRTSTCSAAWTSPEAKRSGLVYGIANGIASISVIFISVVLV
ncbi:Uncharacterised protein [Mycobacteroides abscessus subsp. abscessus]|nr:Uncharacterised protein [Mycobacteroides abscessus subsp. abscessus]